MYEYLDRRYALALYKVAEEKGKVQEYLDDLKMCIRDRCKRLIINSGIKNIVIRDTKDKFREINVEEWIENDDSLEIMKEAGY